MIYVLTVHWQTDQWIDLQLYFLHKYLKAPFKVFAFLNGVADHHYKKFDYVCVEPIEEHAIKLNLLAQIVIPQAKDDDVLLFLDGDAFPIAPIDNFISATLASYSLAAVVRKENLQDQQPHPCFCFTTLSFWKKIKGDWKSGYSWIDSSSQLVSEVGGNLLKQLKDSNINWLQLYRTHSLGDHPVAYGVYQNLIYHHGSGFRPPAERIDINKKTLRTKLLWWASNKSRSLNAVLDIFLQKAIVQEIANHQAEKHNRLYEDIKHNKDSFFKDL